MSNRGWVGQVRRPGRLNDHKAPWEIFIAGQRSARESFATERDAIEAAQALVDQAGGQIAYVDVYRHGQAVHRVAPELHVPRGELVRVQGTSIQLIVQNKQDDGTFVVAGTVKLQKTSQGEIVIIP